MDNSIMSTNSYDGDNDRTIDEYFDDDDLSSLGNSSSEKKSARGSRFCLPQHSLPQNKSAAEWKANAVLSRKSKKEKHRSRRQKREMDAAYLYHDNSLSEEERQDQHTDNWQGNIPSKNPTPRTVDTETSEIIISSAVENGGHETQLPPGVTVEEQQEDALIRILAGQLKREWRRENMENTALERRLRDFKFAQQKRKDKYGNSRPWGILGLYDHLAAIRDDLEWAEDAAWRRANDEPYLSWSDFDENRARGFNKPFFTYILLVICTMTLIASFGVNGWKIEPMSVNPMIGPSAETLVIMGAKKTSLIVNENQWYRLLTPMFLHAGLIHYLLNMMALWFIGKAVEMCHGFVSALVLFVIPAMGGTILSAIFLPEYITVGASGGIFGLIGACLADIAVNWSLIFSKQVNAEDTATFGRHVRVMLWLAFDIVINCIVGFTPFVDNFTHLGGMMYGFLCGLSSMERLSTEFFGVHTGFLDKLRQFLLRFFGLILSVSFILITTVLLAESNGETSPCPQCRFLSCVPFPPWKPYDEKWWYCDDCAMVTADARRGGANNTFDQLSLTCPDETLEIVDISDLHMSDSNELAADLPQFCREYCDSTVA